MHVSSTTPRPVKAAQALFFMNAGIWLLIGVISLARFSAGGPDQWITTLVIAILMLGNVGSMLIAGIGIGRQHLLFYYFGIAVLVVNIVLTFTDEFGVFDLITLLLDMALLGLLIATREHYLAEN